MPALGPRVGKEHEGAGNGRGRKLAQQAARIIGVEADIAARPRREHGEHLDDAILERFAPDNARLGMLIGLPQQVLATPKTDFEPQLMDGVRKQRAGLGEGGGIGGERQAWQQIAPQLPLAGAERPAAPATEAAQLTAPVILVPVILVPVILVHVPVSLPPAALLPAALPKGYCNEGTTEAAGTEAAGWPRPMRADPARPPGLSPGPPSGSTQGRSSPRRNRPHCRARARSGHRPRCGRRSAC